LVEQLSWEGGLIWIVWYLNDGLLDGYPDHIQQALHFIEAQATPIGMKLNRSKSFLWGPAAHHPH
jgi:hypothetical protein